MRSPLDFPRFSKDEIAARHASVKALMDEAHVQGLLFYGAGRFSSEIYWLTDWPGGRQAYLLFQPDKDPVVLLQLYNNFPMAQVLSVITDVRGMEPGNSSAAADLLLERGLGEKRIGVVGRIAYQDYQSLTGKLPRASFVDLSNDFRSLRVIKSAAEVERIRFSSKLTDLSLEALAQDLKPGMREDEIPALLEPVYLKAGGYAGVHYMTSMSMRDPDFQVPAQYQSRRQLKVGDCLITEISGAYWGYSGQIHRTFSLGEGPTQEWRDLHAVAVDVFLTLADLIRDGTSTREVQEAAEVIHSRGYTICDDLLHGANQHPPIIRTRETSGQRTKEILFRENMVIVIQPNVVTLDGKMGLQFGETFVVRKNGCERLNAFPREWIVCST